MLINLLFCWCINWFFYVKVEFVFELLWGCDCYGIISNVVDVWFLDYVLWFWLYLFDFLCRFYILFVF